MGFSHRRNDSIHSRNELKDYLPHSVFSTKIIKCFSWLGRSWENRENSGKQVLVMLRLSRFSSLLRTVKREPCLPPTASFSRSVPFLQTNFQRFNHPVAFPRQTTPFLRNISVEIKPITNLPIHTPISFDHVVPELRPHCNLAVISSTHNQYSMWMW